VSLREDDSVFFVFEELRHFGDGGGFAWCRLCPQTAKLRALFWRFFFCFSLKHQFFVS
jgi:hypothetical protein